MTRPIFAALLAACLAGPVAAQDLTLRAVANSGESDEDYDGLQVFKSYVEGASNGAIEVQIYMGSQLCSNGVECLQGVADGTIDVYVSTSDGVSGLLPYLQVLDLPYLLPDDRVAERVLSGDLVRQLRARTLADTDGTLRLMTIGNTGGWRNFANTQRRITEPADVAGLKLRTVTADLQQEFTRALGAAPTPMPWAELFTSLQTGVVDGTKNGITDIMSMRFPDAGLRYLTLDGHSYMGAFWWMSNDTFTALPPDLKRVVVDGFYQLQQATFASPKRKSVAAYAAFAEAGGDIYTPTPEQKQAFVDAAAPVYDWFADTVPEGAEMLALLRNAIATASEEIDAERAAELE